MVSATCSVAAKGGETPASKRRKSMAPITTTVASAAAPPSTRSRGAGLRPVGQEPSPASVSSTTMETAAARRSFVDLDFLHVDTFDEARHIPGLYCCGDIKQIQATQYVHDKGDPMPESLAGGVSPFHIIDLCDQQGVWQKDFGPLETLGENPSKELRGAVAFPDQSSRPGDSLVLDRRLVPAGLKNLGATCYLNSLLQYLFFNADFRRGLLAASSESDAVRALQQVFALLAHGTGGVVDTGDFVTAAKIDALEQADATEFSALLLDWLERELSKTRVGNESGGNFIPRLFQGEVCQVLQCAAHAEHVFERRERFYELRAQLPAEVKDIPGTGGGVASNVGSKSLEAVVVPPGLRAGGVGLEGATASIGVVAEVVAEARAESATHSRPAKRPSAAGAKKKGPATVWLEQLLEDSAFPEEVLDGANQYECPKCNRKVDARKATRPAMLPPYLHITLERYHYDLKKLERKKLNHLVSFPRRLEMRVPAPASPAPISGPIDVEVATASSLDPVASICSPVKHASAPLPLGTSTIPAIYECIGYLEHVSDSATSGHYTATLLQELLPKGDAHSCEAVSSAVRTDSGEALGKRLCMSSDVVGGGCDGAAGDAAAGVAPRPRTWWKLDDDTVSRVTWVPVPPAAEAMGANGASTSAAAAEAARGAPRRIESTTAYLLIYRRADHAPGQLQSALSDDLPEQLGSLVEAKNHSLSGRLQSYVQKTEMVDVLAADRCRAVLALAKALREMGVSSTLSENYSNGSFRPLGAGLSIVPSAWLQTFTTGAELRCPRMRAPRSMVCPDGHPALVAAVPPVMYGHILLSARSGSDEGGKFWLDPFALWCGQAKLIPTAALAAVKGEGGLDSTLFIHAEGALAAEPCKLAWDCFLKWRKERACLDSLVSRGKLGAVELRAMEGQGRFDDFVCVSTRIFNNWKKCSLASNGRDLARTLWRTFLDEISSFRFKTDDDESDMGVIISDCTTRASDPEESESLAHSSCAAHDVVLAESLVCQHGLLGKLPKDASVTCLPRAEVESLLEAARYKEQAYNEMWLDSPSVPKLRTGLPGERLLCLGDVCPECSVVGTGSGSSPTRCAASGAIDVVGTGGPQRSIVVRQRYASGIIRKKGSIDGVAGPITVAALAQLVLSRLSLPVSRLFLPQTETGKEVEVRDTVSLDETVNSVIVERDENAVLQEKEGAAFESCIFRSS